MTTSDASALDVDDCGSGPGDMYRPADVEVGDAETALHARTWRRGDRSGRSLGACRRSEPSPFALVACTA